MGSHQQKTLCVGKCTSEGLDFFIHFFLGGGGGGNGSGGGQAGIPQPPRF